MLNYRNSKSISILIFFVLIVTSCAETKPSNIYEAFSIQGETQGTTYTIITDAEDILKLQPEIENILLDFDRCLSSYRDSSIISIFSKSDSGTYHFQDISGYFVRCFQLSQLIYTLSDGAFDPSVFPLVEAWGFMKNPALDMSQEQVDSVKNMIGFEPGKDYELILPKNDDKHMLNRFTLKKIRPTLKLDFNAIAQGLAVDVIYEFLAEKGFENFYVEIGGELRVQGVNKEGELWRIGIDVADEKNAANPAERALNAIVGIKNRAVATSGSYRKFYEKNGIKRSHTIDPKTGYPVQHTLLSATVLAENAATADAMATVFMVWGKDKTINYMNNNSDAKLEVLLQYTDDKGEMKTYYSPGMQSMIIQ